MKRHFARKTACKHGHNHASAKEAARCADLHLRLRAGEIDALVVEPTYELKCGERPIRMGNGQLAKYRPDFTYLEQGRVIAEDVKAKNGFIERDVPLRWALFKACYPEIELRVVK